MNNYLRLAFLASILISQIAAADTFLDINVGSRHYDRAAVAQRDLSEVNPGIGYENDNIVMHPEDDPTDAGATRFLGMVGIYRNSLKGTSAYALLGREPIEVGRFKAGIVLGAMTGAKIHPNEPSAWYDLSPAIGAIFSYQFDNIGANLILTPSDEAIGIYGFAGFQLRYKLQ